MMKVTPGPKEYGDRYEMGAYAGAAKAVAGIRDCLAVLHGVQGCNREADHLRTGGPVVDDNYLPAIIISLGPDEVIGGRNEPLIVQQARHMLSRVRARAGARGGGKLCWLFTSCVPSIIQDDIQTVAAQLEEEFNIPVIAIDTASFLGGLARGAELTWIATLRRFGSDSQEKEGINLVGPQLCGANSWPFDSDEMVRLLEAADVKVNHVMFRHVNADQLKELTRAKANVFLSYEDFSEFEEKASEFGVESLGQDLPLPVGLTNTEEWYYALAKKFGDLEKAKAQVKKDMDRTRRITRYNWNATWALTGLYGKHVAILGPATFAASLARCLFYDFNMRPNLLGLAAETKEGVARAEKLLEPLDPYLDFEVMENPSYYQFGEKLKEAGCDFAIGSAFDRHLIEGYGVPHLSLCGVYYKNNWNLVPWPAFGVRGMLYLTQELWKTCERAMVQPQLWQALRYQTREESCV